MLMSAVLRVLSRTLSPLGCPRSLRLALLTPVFLPAITVAVSGAAFLRFGTVAKNRVPGMCCALTMYRTHTSSLGLIP